MRGRHVFFYKLLRLPVALFLRIKFGYTFTVAKGLPETYIVLSNHNTDYDPLMVAASFPRQMYFVGSEHIARWKFAYRLLKYFFAPIPRPKGTLAYTTVLEVLRTVRGGANVCIFAEGARSWDGVTGPILPSTGKMIKSARCGLVTYRIEGGYFASPRWSGSNTRRGRVHGRPVGIYTAEALAAMRADQVNELIARDLHEDAYARQLENPIAYHGRGLAERLENVLFLCPKCGAVDSFTSFDDTISCWACDLTLRYDPYGMLHGGPFETVKELFAWVRGEVARAAAEGTIYIADSGTLSTVVKHQETALASGPVAMSADALRCGGTSIPLARIQDLTMHGRYALVFSTADAYYELRIAPECSALKLNLLYDAYKNLEGL